MANMDIYADKVWPCEGGYGYSPNDAGGPTKYGITIGAFIPWARKFGLTPDVPGLKKMTRDQAKMIMRASFWDFVEGDKLAQPVAEAAMEWAWGSGTGAWKNFKNVVLSKKKDLNLYTQDPEHALVVATFIIVFKWNHCLYYMESDAKQEEWLPGWYLRTLMMMESWYTGKFDWYGTIMSKDSVWLDKIKNIK